MTQEPQKSNTVLIVIAVIGVVGTIVATTIGVLGNYNVEKFRQEAELTKIALVSIATQGGATQVSLASTISAPTSTPYPTNELQPTYTPYPTYTPVPLPTISPTASINLPFADNFDLRLGKEWQPITGTWRIVNGNLTTDAVGGERLILIGDENWQNYAVDVDAWSNEWFYPVKIIVRYQQRGYLSFESTYYESNFVIHSGGNNQVIAHTETGTADFGGNRYGAMYHLRVEAIDDVFTAYINGNMVLQVQDGTYSIGRIGLAFDTSYEPNWFDNFRAEQK
ncbi:MAG TPA: hypothetical protein PKE62_16270 [Anaerolineales bacterium]|nr:hypothetical protein [Anaerolineales bacterium]